MNTEYQFEIIADEKVDGNEEIEADKTATEIRQDSYSLPAGFKWDTLDIRDPLIVRNSGYGALESFYASSRVAYSR
ncbi:hypothetical protein DPMN_058640 [Dreissena polymorpha]|uniref:Uncharacterized protein n=1 Tax=Dreissena polymorpha TaxID=45954 RepID=A0A9D4HFP5_DREPO|nr:hypothetical protein DPMN_058640 [Dreissena polymorpha]